MDLHTECSLDAQGPEGKLRIVLYVLDVVLLARLDIDDDVLVTEDDHVEGAGDLVRKHPVLLVLAVDVLTKLAGLLRLGVVCEGDLSHDLGRSQLGDLLLDVPHARGDLGVRAFLFRGQGLVRRVADLPPGVLQPHVGERDVGPLGPRAPEESFDGAAAEFVHGWPPKLPNGS